MLFEPSKACSLMTFFLLIMSIGSTNSIGAQEQLLVPTGSIWTYSYNETIKEPPSVDIAVDGKWTYTCVGLVDLVFGDDEPQVLGFRSSIKADVSGTIRQQNPFGYYLDISVTGELTIIDYEYYNLTNGLIEFSVADEMFNVENAPQTSGGSILYYDEHNETNYTSVSFDPPDMSIDPDFGNIDPGTNWSVEYRGFSNSTGVNGTKPFSHYYELHKKTIFTYVGPASVTVPAGTFDCRKITYSSEGSNVTRWYCAEIQGDAKVVSSASGDEAVSSLVSYDLEYEEIGGNDGVELDPIILGVTLGIAAAAIIGTVGLYLWKRRPPQAT